MFIICAHFHPNDFKWPCNHSAAIQLLACFAIFHIWSRNFASVAPFVGQDGISHHYGGRFLHIGAETTQG